MPVLAREHELFTASDFMPKLLLVLSITNLLPAEFKQELALVDYIHGQYKMSPLPWRQKQAYLFVTAVQNPDVSSVELPVFSLPV